MNRLQQSRSGIQISYTLAISWTLSTQLSFYTTLYSSSPKTSSRRRTHKVDTSLLHHPTIVLQSSLPPTMTLHTRALCHSHSHCKEFLVATYEVGHCLVHLLMSSLLNLTNSQYSHSTICHLASTFLCKNVYGHNAHANCQ